MKCSLALHLSTPSLPLLVHASSYFMVVAPMLPTPCPVSLLLAAPLLSSIVCGYKLPSTSLYTSCILYGCTCIFILFLYVFLVLIICFLIDDKCDTYEEYRLLCLEQCNKRQEKEKGERKK